MELGSHDNLITYMLGDTTFTIRVYIDRYVDINALDGVTQLTGAYAVTPTDS